MSQAFYGLALLACPVGMGLMMWMMMRGGSKAQPTSRSDDEVARLRAQVDQLQAAQRDGAPHFGESSTPTDVTLTRPSRVGWQAQ